MEASAAGVSRYKAGRSHKVSLVEVPRAVSSFVVVVVFLAAVVCSLSVPTLFDVRTEKCRSDRSSPTQRRGWRVVVVKISADSGE